MYGSNDFERLFIRYKSVAVSRDESMQSFFREIVMGEEITRISYRKR